MDNTFAVYSDPFLGNEIIVISKDNFNFGAIYHPQKTEPLLPWHQTCPHCLRGKQDGLLIQLKRMIQLFCSQTKIDDETLSFKVPSNSDPYELILKKHGDGLITIQGEKACNSSEPYIVSINKKKITVSKNKREYQSPILMRAIKTLSSGRVVEKHEALKILNGLVISQRVNGVPTGNHRPCKKINWFSVLGC